MLINKAYKFRIYPNKIQEILIVKTIGCSRFV
ncbi:helix-turn-helix domain-containing protein, partial [Priestia sp. SIMBA_032]